MSLLACTGVCVCVLRCVSLCVCLGGGGGGKTGHQATMQLVCVLTYCASPGLSTLLKYVFSLSVAYGIERLNAEVAAWMRFDQAPNGGHAPPPFLAMG